MSGDVRNLPGGSESLGNIEVIFDGEPQLTDEAARVLLVILVDAQARRIAGQDLESRTMGSEAAPDDL